MLSKNRISIVPAAGAAATILTLLDDDIHVLVVQMMIMIDGHYLSSS